MISYLEFTDIGMVREREREHTVRRLLNHIIGVTAVVREKKDLHTHIYGPFSLPFVCIYVCVYIWQSKRIT